MASGGYGAAGVTSSLSTGQSTPAMSSTALPLTTPTKPGCGTQGPRQEYNLPMHILGLFLVLFFSCLGAGFPVAAKKFKSLRIPPRVFFFCKHFGTGVLIATAFVHLLPTAFESLNNPCLPRLFTEDYPAFPGVIALMSLFMLFTIEIWMHSKMPHAHSHGSATGEEFSGTMIPQNPPKPPPLPLEALKRDESVGQALTRDDRYLSYLEDEKKVDEMTMKELGYTNSQLPSEMPLWFVAFYEQYVRQRDEMMGMLNRSAPSTVAESNQENTKGTRRLIDEHTAESEDYGVVHLEHASVDPMVYRRMSMEVTLLEGGILFHSVFVGMTVSITTQGFIILLIAILFHQTFEGLGLGSRIAAVPYPQGSIKPWLLVFAFGTTAPIGQAIGLATRNTYDPNSAFALILVGVFNAFSSGLLVYAGLVDLLHADFLSEESDRLLSNQKKMLAFVYVLMGAAAMATVGAFA